MGIPVLIYGRSGSGKSRSLKGFGEEEIFLVNVIGKPLPFPGRFKYAAKTDNYNTIRKGLSTMPTKAAVIDDAGYLLTNTFMRGHSAPKSGSSSFDLYNDIADAFWGLLRFVQDELPEDVIVYLLMHEATSDYGETKLRTIGKLLDEKVCVEGMVSIALRCMVEGDRHFFRTQSSGMDISKSPEGLFGSIEIENDLKFVDTKIREYWNLGEQNEPV
jgi:hypothetical protein